MNRVTLSFFLFFLSSCTNSSDKVIIAENIGRDPILGYVTRFEADDNKKYILSFTPNNNINKKEIYTGKYSIVQDTLYLDGDKRFNKAIFKHGYIEFFDLHWKLKLVKNLTSIDSDISLQHQSDFTFFTYNGDLIFKEGKSVDLNDQDIKQVKSLIQKTIRAESKRFRNHSNENEYFKQGLSILNKRNEKEVWINCISKLNRYTDWQMRIIKAYDGGDAYFNLKINLTTGKVYDISINGEA
ncbi:hypothetical protein [Daejeonella oryzae]|uniref:hypothetical protein n=1 Tax=Daejeonella oryzae TaxID=1122943 RepID=UPI00040B3C4A|nr:hypothetical protein [Daejeonella oryzae]